MELDQLHPSGGYYTPPTPAAQSQKREKELNDMAKSLPVIEELLKDLDELIVASDKLSALNLNSKIPLESQLIAMQELAKFARKEKGKFKAKYESFVEASE